MDQMSISQEVKIAASPEKVFKALTENIGAWWSHSFSEDPKRIALEAYPGGRFFEEFEGGGALYATVVYVEAAKEIRMIGSMGMRGAVAGHIAFSLETDGNGTLLKLSHSAIGEISEEHKAGYAHGWSILLGQELKSFAESL